MPWPRPSIETIYARIKADMEGRVTSGIKIPRVSLLGILALVFAGSMHLMYGFVEWLAKQLFVDTADSDGLKRWGNILNIPLRNAEYTTGTVSFTGTAGYAVVTGTTITSDAGLNYVTQAEYVIGTSSPVAVEAEEAGADYNTDDTTLSLSVPDTEVSSIVTVETGFDNGVDLELQEAWVARLLDRFRKPPSSGNKADYERWAKEADTEVGGAWCIRNYAGAGTVGLVIGTSEFNPVSSQTLQDVTDYIEETKPIPALVTVLNCTNPTVEYEIAISPNTQEMRDAIDEALTKLYLSETAAGGTILLSRMHGAISSTGPTDYAIIDIEVDSVSIGVDDVTSTVPEVPLFTSATYSAI